MAGQVQQLSAVSPREGKALEKTAREGGNALERDRLARKRPSLTDAASRKPPPLPLDEAEADLCKRLAGLMSKAPRRCCEEPPAALVEYSDRIATLAEVVPEPAELPPLPELPAADTATAAPTVHSIKWIQRSRRDRLKTALGYSAAWTVTIAVIAVTVGGATVLTLGAEKSADLAAKASKHGTDIATAAVAAVKLLMRQ